jgi:ribosomal protein S18 acetylase RimI-like enzyme
MIVRFASTKDVETIHNLAHQIWWNTYQNILTQEQIEFMLDDMYSIGSLNAQLQKGISFLIAENGDQASGFASYSKQDLSFKIHKLYILPQQQGKGLGKLLLDFIKEEAKAQGITTLKLNVNRNNPAVSFYSNLGFKLVREIDIPYHHFVLNDFLLELAI